MTLTLSDSPLSLPSSASHLVANTARHRGPELTHRLQRRLWFAVAQALDESNLPYCILGAPGQPSDPTESDLDFAVLPADFRLVPHLLASAAGVVGGRLVQAIQHESTATYFAIARQEGGTVAFINPDCITDYRRSGRLWLTTEELLRDRVRAEDGFFRPSPDTDFKYYFIKQVLKGTLSNTQWRKLAVLYRKSASPQHAMSLWSAVKRYQIALILEQGDAEGFRRLLPSLASELARTADRERPTRKASSVSAEVARVAHRLVNPTGLFVQIGGGGDDERQWLANRLSDAVAPAFRRRYVLRRWPSPRTLGALIASTLVISPGKTSFGFPRGLHLRWRAAMTPGENLQAAIATVLSHLSRRTALRLGLHERDAHQLAPSEAGEQ